MARKDGTGLRVGIILIITFLCLGVSFVQMTIGYKEFGGVGISVIIAIVIVLILFYLNFEILQARRKGEPVAKYIAVYLFFVLVSFAGNFNAFYTVFMKNELLKTEATEKVDALRQLRADAEVAFKSARGLDKKVLPLLSDLDSQIKSKDEPGCGIKCEAILVQIESAIGRKITRLKSPDKNFLAKEYQKIILGKDETELLADLDQNLGGLSPEVEKAEKYPNAYALPFIEKIVEEYKDYATKINKLAGGNFNYNKQIAVDNAEIGRISQTFNSAFKHLFHFGTWISAFLALMIDLFVPLFILFLTKPGEKTRVSLGGRKSAEDLS